MNKAAKKVNSIVLVVSLMIVFAGTALAQETVLKKDQIRSQADSDPATGFYNATKVAPAALKAGEHEKASAISLDLLKQAEMWKENWNYGNAIHVANLVLGRIALKKGETETVIQYFDLCAKFWEKRFSKIEPWKTAIRNGETPDFGANLRYVF